MSDAENRDGMAKQWLSYRSELRIMDCTIRDGGLMNNHQFDHEFVKAVYDACTEAGIDYMEMGYKNSRRIFAPAEHGAWKYCNEDDLWRVVGEKESPVKLSAMADAEKSDYKEDIVPCDESPLDMIRVATYIHQLPLALDMIKDAHDKGYETTVNLMAASTIQERELDEGLELLSESEVDVIYVVDSFGALYSEQVHYLVEKYLEHAKTNGKIVGIHAHNNQQLAFANTIEAIIKGANLADASLGGFGRGAGNCATEQLIGFLHNPKYRLRPLLACLQSHVEPLRESVGWGYDVPYMITGLLNEHPRAGIQFNASEDRGDLLKFYDKMHDKD